MQTNSEFKRGDIVTLDLNGPEDYGYQSDTVYVRIAWIDALGIGGTMLMGGAYPGPTGRSAEYMSIQSRSFTPWTSVVTMDLFLTSSQYEQAWSKHQGPNVNWAKVIAESGR